MVQKILGKSDISKKRKRNTCGYRGACVTPEKYVMILIIRRHDTLYFVQYIFMFGKDVVISGTSGGAYGQILYAI